MFKELSCSKQNKASTLDSSTLRCKRVGNKCVGVGSRVQNGILQAYCCCLEHETDSIVELQYKLKDIVPYRNFVSSPCCICTSTFCKEWTPNPQRLILPLFNVTLLKSRENIQPLEEPLLEAEESCPWGRSPYLLSLQLSRLCPWLGHSDVSLGSQWNCF